MNANLNIIEALGQIAREKNVDRDMVIETLADALVSAARKRYGNGDNFEAQIDPETGSMSVMARKTVVDEVNEPDLEIELEPAQEIDHQAQLGSVVFEELNLADFGRNAIQTAKQILIQRVREAERERIYEEFASRISHIEVATVQQISHGDIILQLGRAEAAVPLKEQIRRERYRQGDSVRGYVFEVIKSVRGPQVLLSRTHPEFLRKLFALEVPEIAEGIVQIHALDANRVNEPRSPSAQMTNVLIRWVRALGSKAPAFKPSFGNLAANASISCLGLTSRTFLSPGR